MMKRFNSFLLIVLLTMLTGVASAQPVRAGKHMLSLQWLGNQYGTVRIAAPDAQGWQRAPGEMHSKEGFLQIDGKLKQTKPRELQFEGVIRSQAGYINDGKVCVRDGSYRFLATGQRKYWRLQEMENCEGGNVVDYIDIYF